jgi:hypothetical protein
MTHTICQSCREAVEDKVTSLKVRRLRWRYARRPGLIAILGMAASLIRAPRAAAASLPGRRADGARPAVIHRVARPLRVELRDGPGECAP